MIWYRIYEQTLYRKSSVNQIDAIWYIKVQLDIENRAGTPEPVGGRGGAAAPTCLLMYDVKIEAFDQKRK